MDERTDDSRAAFDPRHVRQQLGVVPDLTACSFERRCAEPQSGAYFSQHSVLYRDKDCRKGGWPMETPNPNARNMDTARALVAKTREMVGLNA